MKHIVLALLTTLLLTTTARANPEPLRIDIECQGYGRTKACPAFLLGFVEHDPLFLSSPRADADVVLYVDTTSVANEDRLHLRFVGNLAGAPPVVEIDVALDTRADDDTQRGQLEPAFDRGAALYVAALHPEAVQVTLAPVAPQTIEKPATSPFDYEASLAGFGSWTHGYQSLNLFGSFGVRTTEKDSAYGVSVGGGFGATRQPPLHLDDGTIVSLNMQQYSVNAGASAEHALAGRWSGAVMGSIWHDDPKGQYRLAADARAGVEWDLYPADDPRGNRLALGYTLGWQVDRYNVVNERGERFATYPIHALFAGGSVRKDKISYGVALQMQAELDHPMRRHTVSASPFIQLQVGAHVDVDLSVSLSERALPAPVFDPSDYEAVTRAAYAEPLSASGSINLRFHWDRTNGERNDRFSDAGN